MRYFDYLSQADGARLFFRPGSPFAKTTDREALRAAVGGLLYLPGTRRDIAPIILNRQVQGLSSMAICLEDAVGDQERESAIANTAGQLQLLSRALSDGSLPGEALPLLFVRVRDGAMLERMADLFADCSDVLTGVILPKVGPGDLGRSLSVAADIDARSRTPFYAMPILESGELMLCGDRMGLLQELRAQTDRYFDRILNIRMGSTDLCGLYGIRRSVDTSIYSVTMVASCMADVVRVFGIGDRYTVSGPVWEYYTAPGRAGGARSWSETAGLLREVGLDLQNGICGKTCIHPAQLLPVQAGHVVPYETYLDALTVAGGDQGKLGVISSAGGNKMNELKPHALWAAKTLRRAQFYGVYRENTGAEDLLRAVLGGVEGL